MDLGSEELFDANTELRKRNEELDSFVYSTSHDLRAPLTSIMGLLQLIELEKDPEEIERYILQIKSSTIMLDNFIKDIISYTHNKKAGVQKEEIDFKALVDRCISKLSFMTKANVIDKIVNIQVNDSFISDPQRLDNLLSNLISNSIKYCNHDQKHPFFKIDICADSEKVEITVSDNGVGIKNEHLEKVFDMFYRASPMSKGSGIGLYIVKEIVEKLSGKIQVASVFGEGSTFQAQLPNIA